MIKIPRRSSNCQIAISTDNRQVTKCCHGTKTTDGKIQWVRMRCWTLVFVGGYLYVSVQRIEWEYYVSYCQTAHHNHRGILKGFCRATAMITSVLKTSMQKKPEWNSGDGKRSCQFYVSGVEHYLKSQQSRTPRRADDWSSAPPWFYPEVWKKECGTSIQGYSISAWLSWMAHSLTWQW